MEALLEVRKLCIGIQQETTLLSSVEDVSFDIYPGEIVGLAGESGSGKSLTALSVAGLLGENKKVTKGSILYKKDADTGALNLLSISEKEFAGIRGKEISMIFQEPFSSLNPLVKVGAQIAETLELHGEKDKALNKGRVRGLMEKLGLPEAEKLESAYPHRLSGGMCQRIMIALAIICRPRLLIADEPVTALDFNTQIQILGLMKEINRDLGASILFISHDLGLIKNFCDRVLVMYSGRILEEGKTNEVFTNPAHEYTRGLLGSIPEKRGKDLAAIPGRVPSLEEGRPKGCPFHPRCAKAMQACMEDFPEARSAGADHTSRCVLEKGQ